MELSIEIADLQKKKLMCATPMYGGMAFGTYVKSMLDLTALCCRYGVEMRTYYLFNESLIQRARTYCMDEFMRSDCTHLLFVDADIGFKAEDVFAMLALQNENDPDCQYSIVAGAYPKKTIAWEKVKAACDQGFADGNPAALQEFVGDYVFNLAEGVSSFKLSEPVEVAETGTGFMMIMKKAVRAFEENNKHLLYTPDHARTANFDGSRQIYLYFHCEIDPQAGNRYLSEDYWFCKKVREAGEKVWVLPWIQLSHTGTYCFGGTLAALASINASPTASVDSPRVGVIQ